MKLFISLCLTTAFAIAVIAQDDKTTKLIIQNKSVVEITPDETDQPYKDLTKIIVKVNGKLVKSFAAHDFSFPQVIGTFHGITWNIGQNADAEYILFRTSMGSGACVGGTLYVLAFLEDDVTGEFKNVHVSLPLTTCLGEYPAFAFANTKAGTILDIAGHTLNLDKFEKWVEKKKVVKTRRKK